MKPSVYILVNNTNKSSVLSDNSSSRGNIKKNPNVKKVNVVRGAKVAGYPVNESTGYGSFCFQGPGCFSILIKNTKTFSLSFSRYSREFVSRERMSEENALDRLCPLSRVKMPPPRSVGACSLWGQDAR